MILVDWLIELLLPRIIGIVLHKREKLTTSERKAKEAFLKNLQIVDRKTPSGIIIAMIGLVGSGKSTVAKALAEKIGGTVIEGDAIRVKMKEHGASYERARAIAEDVALEVLRQGGNAILDSDFIDVKKRASLREKARKAGVKLFFICTYAQELDLMLERMISDRYDGEEFFSKASTPVVGSKQTKATVVKLREMVRRMPLHYRWSTKGGGEWAIKNPPCKVLADIDTTSNVSWEHEIESLAKQLMTY